MSYDQFLENLTDVKRKLQEAIFNALKLDKQKAFSSPHHTHSTIIDFLKSHSDRTSVFTTNYDCVIEEYMKQCEQEYMLVDGFKLTGQILEFHPEVFHENYDPSPRPVFLHKLHGSLNWAKIDGKIQRAPAELHSDDVGYQNMLIYPTLSPKDNASDLPYSALFKLFEMNMRDADALIVIGFSFRDKKIAKTINEAFVNGKKKLVIVSPDGIDDYYKNLRGEDAPQNLQEPFDDEFKPNDRTLILNRTLDSETTVKIFSKIGDFLAGKN